MKKECIADKIELHIRYALDNIVIEWIYDAKTHTHTKVNMHMEVDEIIKKEAIELCKNIRGEMFWVGRRPKVVAGAICSYVSIKHNSRPNRDEIAKALGIGVNPIYDTNKILKQWVAKNS